MKASKYQDKTDRLQAIKGNHYTLLGDMLLVERAEPEEVKTKSGIIMATDTSDARRMRDGVFDNMPVFVRVIDVGSGYYDDETKEEINLEVRPGDIILVGRQSVRWLGMLEVEGYEPLSLGLTREAEIQLRFHGDEGYKAFMKALGNG